jgi:hypothetical protein
MKSTFIPILRMAIFLFFSKVVTAPTQPAVPTSAESLVGIKDVLAAWTGYEKFDMIFRLITGTWAFLVWWYSVALNKLVEIETSLASAAASQVKIAASQEKIADSQEMIAIALNKFLFDNNMAEASATGADTSNTADENENIQIP